MRVGTVRAPASILLDRNLSTSAKLLWICLQLENADEPAELRIAKLRANSRLALATVERGLQELENARLAAGGTIGSQRAASLPLELLRDRRLRAQPKLLYGVLQLTRRFRKEKEKGHFKYEDLSTLVGITAKPLRNAVRALERTRWLSLVKGNRFTPTSFTLGNAVAEERRRQIAAIDRHLRTRKPYGETLMRAYLNVLINSTAYYDNARPDFLVCALTGERLEFDRYYPPNVAFEFHGPQHDGPTEKYPDEREVAKQQARDAIKMDICKRRGIALIVYRRADLTFATMRQSVAGLTLPLTELHPSDPVIAHLEQLSLEYRERKI